MTPKKSSLKSKDELTNVVKDVARDLGRYGVTVNAIAPRASTRMIADIPGSASEIRARSGVAPIAGEEDLASMDPDHIAPFVAYLASDFAENVNGQTFLVYGDTISLVSQPRPMRAIYEPSGTWDMEKLSEMARDVLTKDIDNPAPARE